MKPKDQVIMQHLIRDRKTNVPLTEEVHCAAL